MPAPDRVRNGSRQVAALLAAILLGVTTTAAGKSPSGAPVPFQIIAAGSTSAIRLPAQVVVRSERDWVTLWRQHAGLRSNAVPAIDFDRNMVIAIFAGEVRVPTAIAIARITREPDHLVAWYTLTETRPSTGAEGSVVSTPYAIVQMARSAFPVRFVQMKTQPVLRRVP